MLRGVPQVALMDVGLPAGVVLAIPITEASGAPGAVIDGAPVAGAATVGATGRETVGGVFGATFSSAVVGYGDVTALDGATAATWVVSMRPANLTQVAGVLNKRVSGISQNAYSFGLNYIANDFTVQLGTANGLSIAYSYRFSRAAFTTDTYQQIVIVFDNAADEGDRIRLWRNNSEVMQVAAATDPASPVAISNTTAPLELGRVNNATAYYSGGIAYAYTWRRALSTAEIAAVWDVLGAGDKVRPTS